MPLKNVTSKYDIKILLKNISNPYVLKNITLELHKVHDFRLFLREKCNFVDIVDSHSFVIMYIDQGYTSFSIEIFLMKELRVQEIIFNMNIRYNTLQLFKIYNTIREN